MYKRIRQQHNKRILETNKTTTQKKKKRTPKIFPTPPDKHIIGSKEPTPKEIQKTIIIITLFFHTSTPFSLSLDSQQPWYMFQVFLNCSRTFFFSGRERMYIDTTLSLHTNCTRNKALLTQNKRFLTRKCGSK